MLSVEEIDEVVASIQEKDLHFSDEAKERFQKDGGTDAAWKKRALDAFRNLLEIYKREEAGYI